jgi:hypothetical protein
VNGGEPFRRPVRRKRTNELKIALADLGLAGVGLQIQNFIGVTHGLSLFLGGFPRLRLPWTAWPGRRTRDIIVIVIAIIVIVEKVKEVRVRERESRQAVTKRRKSRST